MCIRDSAKTVGVQDLEARCDAGQQVGDLAIGKTMLLAQGTVSYTHLRAHETVLDLVCRLLLETKNHNTTNVNPHDTHVQE